MVHIAFFDPLTASVLEKETLFFEAIDSDSEHTVRGLYKGPWPGVLRLGLPWSNYEKV